MSPAPVVVITGASAGVGRATARAFARLDSPLALLARDEEGLAAARDEAEAEGVPAAHGRFSGEAKSRSVQLWATKHRGVVGVMAGLALAGLLRR